MYEYDLELACFDEDCLLSKIDWMVYNGIITGIDSEGNYFEEAC